MEYTVDLEALKERISNELEVLGSYVIPNDYENFKTDLNEIIEEVDLIKRELMQRGEPYNHLQIAVNSLEVLLDENLVLAKQHNQSLNEIFESVVGTLQDIIE